MARTALHPRMAALRTVMRQLGVNGAELAAGAGVSKQFICLLLQGRRRCLPATADSIATQLSTPTNELFCDASLCDESHNNPEEETLSPNSLIALDDPYLLFDEAAALIRMKPKTLRALRASGDGPPFFRRGQRLMIRRSKLQDWFESTYENAD